MLTVHFKPIDSLPNAPITECGKFSRAFLARDVDTFQDAARFVQQMPYGYNHSSEDSMILLEDGFGTCYTKHGIIVRLAEELNLPVIRCEGVYALDDAIVCGANAILAEYDIPFIPRVHCFLKYQDVYVDLTEGNCTGKNKLIEEYLDIYPVAAELTQQQMDQFYDQYYSQLYATNPTFAKLGVPTMHAVRTRCEQLNKEVLCSIT